MKVNSLSDSPTGALTGAGKAVDRPSTGASRGASSTRNESVTVSLSATTQTLAGDTGRGSTDVFNSQKVEAVRQAIENGSFSVNAEAIADKLLSNAREMLSVAAK